jgi:ABC-type tungstate transport system substrate-binding protein
MPLMEQELPTVLVGYIILYVLARVGNFLEFVFQMGLQSVIKLNLDSPLNIVKIFFQIFEDANNQLISE